jgi:rare lipoprotein A
MPGKRVTRVALLLGIGLLLAACGGMAPRYSLGTGPRVSHPTYKIGTPYTIKGITYYPHVDYAYDQTGLASWYGEAFDGQYTANGEVFDLNQITAAHKTLPLPSIVEVINLQNNRALRVRVNDRGPFVDGRVIDVSRRVAQLLGFERSGTAMVRVRVLKDESMQAEAAAAQGIVSNGSAFASAAPTPPPTPTLAVASRPAAAPVAIAAVTPPPQQIGRPTPVYQGLPQAPATPASHHFLVQSPLYRMEIGPVETQEEANRALAQMIQSGYRDAHIVMN